MPDRDFDREPRWNNTGYWTDRGEDENREGDQENVRNYNREDQRRYGRQSQEQADRLRRLRGQDEGEDRGARNSETQGSGPSRLDERGREMYRGYGPRVTRDEGRYDENASRMGDDDYDAFYDAERDYRDTPSAGRDMNMEGRGEPGRRERDPYRLQDQGREGDPRSEERYGNFWGQRRQGRQQPGGYISARGGSNASRAGGGSGGIRRDAWDDDRDWSMDPGFQYEFGTDYDFMNSAPSGSSRGRREPWDVPGPYAGVGPRNYRRPDERINEEICEVFTRHGRLDASGIEINVQEGQVTLNGSVDNRTAKRLAEDLAANVWGVKDVENRLRVAQPGKPENR